MPAPPLELGVGACESWAMSLGLVACAAQDADLERIKAVRLGLRKLGQLRDKAQRSEKAVHLLRLRRGLQLDLVGDDPPAQVPAAGCAWAYLKLCRVLHAMTQGAPADWRTLEHIETLATLGFVPGKAAISALIAELRRKE